MWINRRLIWFFEQTEFEIRKVNFFGLKYAFGILHTELLSTASLFFDTSSTLSQVTGTSSCAVVISVVRKICVMYSATVCGKIRLYYEDIATLGMLSVINMQATFLCFLCVSRKPIESVWEGPRELLQMAVYVQGTSRSFHITGTDPVKAAL